ncbi:MAG: hypothetical protein ACOCX8_00190 [Bacteroidota bacterium]
MDKYMTAHAGYGVPVVISVAGVLYIDAARILLQTVLQGGCRMAEAHFLSLLIRRKNLSEKEKHTRVNSSLTANKL